MNRILVVGSGDVARRAIPWLAKRARVYALVRSVAQCEAIRALGAIPVVGDLDDRRSLARLAGIADRVLHCAPPPATGQDDPRTRHLVAALRRRSLARALVYIGTSGVYGDCAGEWVAESRPCRPASARARRRVDAERALRGLGRSGSRVSILRAPGIYAAERLSLERLERGDPVLAAGDDVFTNHIHADDLAMLCCLALYRGRPNRTYNASDDSHLRMGDYFDLMADTFGLPRPPRVARSEAASRLSPMTLSFMSESRRLDNRRIKQELRARLRYPDVAAGLAAARAHRSIENPGEIAHAGA
ncbi:MAG: NAD-dependent epimerase/dehydratase family protein [Rhodocyclaceae bacterium]|nr:NAD-dependent epimerase/dehydratase family protein [Rhodocyclaceae bacterium]